MYMVLLKIQEFYNLYLYYLRRGDDRVKDWPLMSSYAPTWILSIAYLLIVFFGIRLMENRKAVNLRWSMLIYNFLMVILNLHIFSELLYCTSVLGYNYSCQPVNYTNDSYEMRIASALWWYYISKFIEFMDTFFFILRKKNSQISILHVYHHFSMFPIWWIGVKWVPGGQSFFGAMMNSFIHVLMYVYYGMAGLGEKYQKFLWWKRYLTKLQLIQFVLGITHAAQGIYFDCSFPKWMQWALILYGTSIMAFFLNFYNKAYIQRPVSFQLMFGSLNDIENITQIINVESFILFSTVLV